jgi:hypothetical protein
MQFYKYKYLYASVWVFYNNVERAIANNNQNTHHHEMAGCWEMGLPINWIDINE